MLMKLTPGVKKFRIRIEQLERPTKKSGYSHSFYQYVTEKRERETKKSGLFFVPHQQKCVKSGNSIRFRIGS